MGQTASNVGKVVGDLGRRAANYLTGNYPATIEQNEEQPRENQAREPDVPEEDEEDEEILDQQLPPEPGHDIFPNPDDLILTRDIPADLRPAVREYTYQLERFQFDNREWVLDQLQDIFCNKIYEETRYHSYRVTIFQKLRLRAVTNGDHVTFDYYDPRYYEVIERGIEMDDIIYYYKMRSEQMRALIGLNMGSGQIVVELVYYQKLIFIGINDIAGNTYFEHPLIFGKKHLVNVRNTDNKCFLWSIAAYLQSERVVSHPERTSNYDITKFILKDIEMPMKISDISKFEDYNDLKINVFGFDKDGNQMIIRLSKDPENAIDLLLVEKDDLSHYVLIKNFSKFTVGTKFEGEMTFRCKRCMIYHHRNSSPRDKELIEEHLRDCGKEGSHTKVILPKEGSVMKFENFKKTLAIEHRIYYDFESFLVGDAKYVNTHMPNSFSISTVFSDPQFNTVYCSRVYDPIKEKEACIEDFLAALQAAEDNIKSIKKHCKKELPTDEFIARLDASKECEICGCELKGKNVMHSQINGKILYVCCAKCYKIDRNIIPVMAHNSRGYDGHLFIKQMFESIVDKEYRINCIAQNKEKYLSFSRVPNQFKGKKDLYELRFLDTFAFLADSLDSVAKSLVNKDTPWELKTKVYKHTYKYITENYTGNEKELFHLAIRKGVYPYEYINSVDKMALTELPPIAAFNSDLYSGKITRGDKEFVYICEIAQKEYDHAERVWKAFGCRTFADYHRLYLLIDTLLLTDIFENFREMCIAQYRGLDPCNYYTTPGYAFDAMLLVTGVKLDLLSDINMVQFVEKTIRGGISIAKHRYAKSGKNGNGDNENIIRYYDANNLYGCAMLDKLPTGGFKWVVPTEDLEFINNIGKDGRGAFLEIDIDYPEELHDYFKEYPPLADHFCPTEDMLSSYQKAFFEKVGKTEKLACTLINKRFYKVHYKMLQFVLTIGMKLVKVHRILSFDESDFMRPFISMNTTFRKAAKTDFEKNFYKLMNNSVFGKTMENVRNRIDFEICNPNKHVKLASSPLYSDTVIFSDKMLGVLRNRKEVTINKPIYIGAAILDISKVIMYDFHYNTVLPAFPDVKLIFTDTDSLTYLFNTTPAKFDEFVEDNFDKFDTSNYEPDHPHYSKKNAKVEGKFKSETGSEAIQEIVSLRSKCYAYTLPGMEDHNKSKGTKRCISNKMKMEDYKYSLFTGNKVYADSLAFRSIKHEIKTIAQRKIALNPFDDKNYILDDGISTLPFGHKDIAAHKAAANVVSLTNLLID